MTRYGYETREQLDKLEGLWRDIENVSTHARSQVETKLHSYHELMSYVKIIREDLKKIESMVG